MYDFFYNNTVKIEIYVVIIFFVVYLGILRIIDKLIINKDLELRKLKKQYYKYIKNNNCYKNIEGLSIIIMLIIAFFLLMSISIYISMYISKFISTGYLYFVINLFLCIILFYLGVFELGNNIVYQMCLTKDTFIIKKIKSKEEYIINDISYIGFYIRTFILNKEKVYRSRRHILFMIKIHDSEDIIKYKLRHFSIETKNLILMLYLAQNNQLDLIPNMTLEEYKKIYEEVYINE